MRHTISARTPTRVPHDASSFAMPLPLPVIPDLPTTLQLLLDQIPCGQVATYGGLADALGCRTAARWVGEYLRDHPHTARCVCHRVVRIDGSIGLYVTGSSDEKARKLQSEGVLIQDGRVELNSCRFSDFNSAQPLATLVDWQKQVAKRVRLSTSKPMPDIAAGLDVAYAAPGRAIGVYVLYDLCSSVVLWSKVIEQPASFPYIPGLLTFRELPVFSALLNAAHKEGVAAPLLFVDGNGILHPRRSGIATAVGVMAGVPTIGVGKKLLCGKVEQTGTSKTVCGLVLQDDELLGAAIRSSSTSRTIYVSPGNKVDVETAALFATSAFRGHRLPEPLFQADALSKRAARLARIASRI